MKINRLFCEKDRRIENENKLQVYIIDYRCVYKNEWKTVFYYILVR